VIVSQAVACGVAGYLLGVVISAPVIRQVGSAIPWLVTPSWLPLAILPLALSICILRRLFRSARRWPWSRQGCFVPEKHLAVAGVSVWYGTNSTRTRALKDVSLSFTPGADAGHRSVREREDDAAVAAGMPAHADEGTVYVNGAEVSRNERAREDGDCAAASASSSRLPAISFSAGLGERHDIREISGGRRHRASAPRRLLEDFGLAISLGSSRMRLAGARNKGSPSRAHCSQAGHRVGR